MQAEDNLMKQQHSIDSDTKLTPLLTEKRNSMVAQARSSSALVTRDESTFMRSV